MCGMLASGGRRRLPPADEERACTVDPMAAPALYTLNMNTVVER
jgi:hypothetical protein